MSRDKTTGRNFKASLTFGFVIVFCLLFAGPTYADSPQTSSPPDLTLTILHTNDLHAHDESFQEQGRTVGGMARIIHVIRGIKRDTPNVLTVDAGDIFQGTPFFKFYHGAVEVALLNMAGYDIFTPGNHEFDDHTANLAKQLKEAKFAVLSCNLDLSGNPDLAAIIKPSIVKTVDGRKIAFIGASTPDLEQISLTTDSVHIKDAGQNWMQPVKDEVKRLRSQGIDKIILVSHIGVERDRQIAGAVPELDAIIGGHSHTRLDEPIVVKHEDGTATVIVQTGCYGRTLGKLKLAFDAAGHVIVPDVDYHLINITDRIYEEPDVLAYIQQKSGPVQALRAQAVGTALDRFDNRFARCPCDSALGDLICDALAEEGTKYGVTISFTNRGGIRSGLEKGVITMADIEEILPFDNRLTFATVSGKTILQTLEHSVSEKLGGKFLDVHGLKFAYDPDKPAGERIVFALAADSQGRWRKLDPAGKYKIAINDYNFKGGEGYNFSGAADVEFTPEKLSEVLTHYLSRHKEVKPGQPSRIIPVHEHLVSLVRHQGREELEFRNGPPGARLTLVSGSGPGVEAIAGATPAPLSDARVIESGLKADESGEYFWPLPIEDKTGAPDKVQSKGKSSQEKRWLAVIVHPGKSESQAEISSSYPFVSAAGTVLLYPQADPRPAAR